MDLMSSISRELSLPVLGAKKSAIKVLAESVLVRDHFLIHKWQSFTESYMVNESISPSGVSFMRALIAFVMAPPS